MGGALPDSLQPKPRLPWVRECSTFFLGWFLLAALLGGCGRGSTPSVIVYTSQDEVFAEPLFKQFEKETGITVRAVFDSEAVKTVGLANRLQAEQSHPQCDVFWNNEEFRTRELASKQAFRETNGWVQLGYRSRRLVINTNLVPLASAPKSFSEVTNVAWRGKVVLAYPLFGTTATHFLALRQAWGASAWQDWCRALAANKSLLVDGNSVVVKMVGSGEAAVGFTDSDDIAEAQRDGQPVLPLPLNPETLLVHNSAGVVRNAPHPVEAQKFLEFLQGATVQQALVTRQALESALPADQNSQPGLKVDWPGLLRDLEPGARDLKTIFLR